MDNNFINKLNEKSKDLSKIYFEILQNEKEKNNKKIFLKLLFNDLIEIKDNKEIWDNILNDNYENILQNSFDSIFNKIENNDIVLNNLVNISKSKKADIKKKIKECDDHLIIIIKFLKNSSFKKYFSINNPEKLIFKDKTVLNLFKNEDDLDYAKLGEFFIRFIFTIISKIKDNKNKNNFKNLKSDNDYHLDKFYDSTLINNYYNKYDSTFKNFNEINNKFKYIFILLFFMKETFSKNSDYTKLFDNNEFNKLIKIFLVKYKTNDKKKLNKKLDKQLYKQLFKQVDKKIIKKSKKVGNKSYDNTINILYGGGKKDKQFYKNKIKDGNRSRSNKYKKTDRYSIKGKYKNDQKQSEKEKLSLNIQKIKKTYIDIFEKIKLGSESNVIINYNNFYKNYFKNSMVNYLEKNLGEKTNISLKIKNPFDNSDYSIKTYLTVDDKNKTNIDLTKRSIEERFKFNIFESFAMLIDDNNKEDINKFISNVQYYFILILYRLYKIKREIYITYINILNKKFNLNENTSKQNNKSKKINKTEERIKSSRKSSIRKSSKKIIYLSDNIQDNDEITKKIKLIEKEIDKLQDKKGIKEYDDKIVLLEEAIKKLIVEKYKK
jgi:hypothetical protein